MRVSRGLHRLFRNSLLVLLVFTGVGVLFSLVPALVPPQAGAGFAYAFFVAGLVWMAVAWFSGGFVATYRAPILATQAGNPFYYAVRDRMTDLTLPSDGPAVMADLREKMSEQPAAMLVAFLKGLAFFGLAALFYLAPDVGEIALAVAIGVFAVLFVQSRGEPSEANRT